VTSRLVFHGKGGLLGQVARELLGRVIGGHLLHKSEREINCNIILNSLFYSIFNYIKSKITKK
jgi:hypothetical protein